MKQKVSDAVKNMAQRAMWRGKVGQAETINSLGESAATSILRNDAKPLSSNAANQSTGVHSVVVQENVRDVKQDLQSGGHAQPKSQTQNNNQNKKLGDSILDALK